MTYNEKRPNYHWKDSYGTIKFSENHLRLTNSYKEENQKRYLDGLILGISFRRMERG